jgi:hypothetical protein
MSTRKRNNVANPTAAPKSDLPPSRQGKATAKHKTNLPFARVRFNTFIYLLSALALAFLGFNVWRVLQWKSAAGGWWNFALGKRPPAAGSGGSGHAYDVGKAKGGDERRDNVEDRINALAKALGLQSHDLASAIADAVKSHVPPASLSSVAAAEATKSGTAVGVLVGEEEAQKPGTGMGDKLSAFAGFDDPVVN